MEDERVREEIRQLIQDIYDWPYQLGDGAFNEWAAEILAIKGIRIECDKQDVELYPETFATGLILPSQAEMEMLRGFLLWLKHEAGFVKVLPEKE